MKYIATILSLLLLMCYKKGEIKIDNYKNNDIISLENNIINDTIKSHYFNSDGIYDLSIHLYDLSNIVLFDYFCTMSDNGAINERLEENQYAGKFFKSDIKNNRVSFYIVNYREDTVRYLLNLSFINDSAINWYIDSTIYKYTPYLPHDFILYKAN